MSRRFVLAALLLAAAGAQASPAEDAVKAELRMAHPQTRFDAVRATPVAGVFEVQMGENRAYVMRGFTRYLVFGQMFDTKLMREVGTPRAVPGPASSPPEASPVDFNTLPLTDAIKEVRGAGTRRLAVFSDPKCPYCRQLDGELAQLQDVTIYHFPVGFLGTELPQEVWCARDRLQAWRTVLATGERPKTGSSCANPIARNAELARRLGIRGTPTLLFADGRRLESAVSVAEIETYLGGARQ